MSFHATGQQTAESGAMVCQRPDEDLLTKAEIAAWSPAPWSEAMAPVLRARRRMENHAQWTPTQLLGRRWSIGCVALEITQRCNLDCALCYLSENAESAHDLPLAEVFRRIDAIAATYGPGTGVQVTGGDPTLRTAEDLCAIVSRIRARNMRPSLFTNGIRASRGLLATLADAGLQDVAFHVDTTQQRKGFQTEADLNAVRREYIERARGLGLNVFFNTTVHDGNRTELAMLARFFVQHSDAVRVASFQLQADTGRGVLRGRPNELTMNFVAQGISSGLPAAVTFLNGIGHGDCNRYAVLLTAGDNLVCATADERLAAEALAATAGLPFDLTSRWRRLQRIAGWAFRHPFFLFRASAWGVRSLWRLRGGLIKSRGRVDRISFFVHDFMHACQLRRDRIEACSFMVATADGPVSMCLHNAKRDEFVLRPFTLPAEQGGGTWDPTVGEGRRKGHTVAKGRSKQPMGAA